VIAARVSEARDTLESCSIRTLAPGALTPGLTNTNVVDRDALAGAVSDALSAMGVSHHRDIITVIPDAACRIALLDFETLPEKPQDADAVVRFRLKKSLPFDVDRARVSYDVQRLDGTVHVVAVVALPTVLDEYESVLRTAGFSPGVVLPSSLGALGLVDGSRPTLLLKIAAKSVSLAIVHNNALLLFRTLETDALDSAQLAEDIYPSLVFFQDTYGTKIERVLVDGAASFKELAPAIENSTGIRVQELVDASVAGTALTGAQRPFVGGILGALIS
jgi:type IV pilus assembly protein PilM